MYQNPHESYLLIIFNVLFLSVGMPKSMMLILVKLSSKFYGMQFKQLMSQLFIQTSFTDTRTMFNKYKRGICFGDY